jgi:hypothetical protein
MSVGMVLRRSGKRSKEGRNLLKSRRRLAVALAAVGLGCAIGFSGVALAAGGLAAPQLRSPRQGKAVGAGRVKLTVYVPNPEVLSRHNVFVVVSDKRVVKDGLLQIGKHCGFRCVIDTMKHHSTHLWTYLDHFQFPGLWQDTPGTYYWQAYYYPNTGVLGVVRSRIKSFRIVG